MKKITKQQLEKHFHGVYKEASKNKTLAEEIEEYVKAVAIKELEAHGDDGMDKIVIENVSIEIWADTPEGMTSSEKGAVMATKSAAASNCYYYCYVIGGTRICRRICR